MLWQSDFTGVNMGNNKIRRIVCPHCHAKQELPEGSHLRKFHCDNCDTTVRLGKAGGYTRRSRESSAPQTSCASEAHQQPAKPVPEQPETKPEPPPLSDIFAEKPAPDPNAVELLEDEAARGRFARKKSVGEFKDSLTSTDEKSEANSKGRRRRIKKRKAKQDDSTVAAWEDSEEMPKSDTGPTRASLVTGGAVILLVALMIVIVVWNGLQEADRQRFVPTSMWNRGDSMSREARYEKGIQAIREFLEAQSVDDVISRIRNPARVAPLVRLHYSRNPYKPISYAGLPKAGSMAQNKNMIAAAIDLDGINSRPIVLELVGDEYKVDWESWVGFSKTSWRSFIDQRLTEPNLFRVKIALDNYYNFRFSDSLSYQCYEVQDQDSKFQLYAYTEKGSTTDQTLRQWLNGSTNRYGRVTLSYPKDNPDDTLGVQVLINDAVGVGWVDGLNDE